MVKIGTIAIDLVAHTGKLLKPLKQAEAAVSGFMGKAAKLGGLATAIAAPVLGAMTLQRVFSDVKQSFEDLGAISNESKRLGIPADQLMALQYAARQADVEMETLGKSLQVFLKGGGRLADLPKIADKFAAMKDPAKRMQEALKLFGKGGAGMINLFEEGAAGLQKMTDEARKLGRVFTQAEVDTVESAGDAWARIGEMLKAISDRLAIEVAPYVTWLSDQIVAMGTDGETTFGEKIAKAIDFCIDKVGIFADAVWSLRDEWKYASIGLAGFAALMEDAWNQATANIKEVGNWLNWVGPAYQKKLRSFLGVERLLDMPGNLAGAGRYKGQEVLRPYDVFGAAEAQKKLESSWDKNLKKIQDMIKDLEKSGTGKKPSEMLKDIVNFMRSSARGIGGKPFPDVDTEAAASKVGVQMIGALERGSVAAMSTIIGTQRKNIEEQQLNELKQIKDGVDAIVDDALVLRRANLA